MYVGELYLPSTACSSLLGFCSLVYPLELGIVVYCSTDTKVR
jgi:hypothetical protein